MAGVIEVTDATFDAEVLQSSEPVLVDFWATWCAPCKAIAPVVDQLAEKYAGQVKFVKMNSDDNPRTPARYNIRSLPTLLVFKGGEIVRQQIGAAPAQKIEGLVQGLS